MEIRLDLLSWSFGAGIFAFFNPCGFAMLPAYVAHYLGRVQGEGGIGVRTLVKGLSLGGVVSGGFITVFAALGIVISFIGSTVGALLPWVGLVIGIGLIVLGALMLFGIARPALPVLERLAGRISRTRGNPGERDLPFYYVYGVTYALASTGCTLPIFLVVVGVALQAGLVNGLVQFGAYALGMTLMMLALSVAMVFSKEFIRRVLPPIMRGVRWVGALGVMAAGAYLIWYNVFYAGFISF